MGVKLLRPLLFIGIGDSGGKALRATKHSLVGLLRENGWEFDLPSAWQFIHLDYQDDQNSIHLPALEKSEVLDLNLRVEGAEGLIRNTFEVKTDANHLLAGWGVNSKKLNLQSTRSGVRQSTMLRAELILKRFKNATISIQSIEAIKQLREINDILNMSSVQTTPEAIFFSNVCETSASSLFDVAEILKLATQEKWASEATTVLISTMLRRETSSADESSANTLAFISEFMSSRNKNLSERSRFFYEKMGINYLQRSNGFFGPKNNILVEPISDRSSTIILEDFDSNTGILEIGEMVASSIFTRDDKPSFWNASIKSTFDVNRSVGQIPLLQNPELNVVNGITSIGHLKVTLGAPQVKRYSTDLLTYKIIEMLLSESDTTFTDELLISRIIGLKSAILNRVISAVEAIGTFDKSIINDIVKKPDDGINQFLYINGVNDLLNEFYFNLCEFCEIGIFTQGIQATISGLNKLEDLLSNDVFLNSDDLPKKGVTKFFQGKDSNPSPFAKKDRVAEISMGAESVEINRNDLVAAINKRIFYGAISNYCTKLRDALTDAHKELKTECSSYISDDEIAYTFYDFAQWGINQVGGQYRTKCNEISLINLDDLQETFKELTSISNEKELQTFVVELLTSYGTENSEDNALKITTTEFTDSLNLVTQVKKVKLNLSIDLLRNVIEKKLCGENTPIGRFISGSILQYINDSPNADVRTLREEKFVSILGFAIEKAKPTAQLNEMSKKLIGASGGTSVDDYLLKVDSIPFSIDSNIGRKVKDILHKPEISPANLHQISDWFKPTVQRDAIHVNTVIRSTVPIWTIQSIFEPIRDSIEIASNSEESWIKYWEGRRARPLAEFVPLSPQILQSVVTGWMIARLFGLIDVESFGNHVSSRIWNPTLDPSDWSQFSTPLLGRYSTSGDLSRDALPNLLLSISVSLMNCSHTGNLDEMDGYQLLQFLGREVTTFVSRDSWDFPNGDNLKNGITTKSNVINQWVQNGAKPSDLSIDRHLMRFASDKGTNQSGLLAMLELWSAEYDKLWLECEELNWPEIPLVWELKTEINLALADLQLYVSSLKDTVQTVAPVRVSPISIEENHRVFISHSSQEIDLAKDLSKCIQELGVSTWLAPNDIPVGQDFAAEIFPAIDQSTGFALIVSRGSLSSRHVRREFDYAESKGLPIVPISLLGVSHTLSDFPPEWQYRLNVVQMIQHIDVVSSARIIVDALKKC